MTLGTWLALAGYVALAAYAVYRAIHVHRLDLSRRQAEDQQRLARIANLERAVVWLEHRIDLATGVTYAESTQLGTITTTQVGRLH